jgi:hypothetical protein
MSPETSPHRVAILTLLSANIESGQTTKPGSEAPKHAGEGWRVGQSYPCQDGVSPVSLSSAPLFTFFSSPSICLRGNGEWGKQRADEAVGVCVFLAFTCANVRFWRKEHI